MTARVIILARNWHILMVSCQKGPNRHAYAWQIGPFWQDTLDMCRIDSGEDEYQLNYGPLEDVTVISKALHSYKWYRCSSWALLINFLLVNATKHPSW